MFTCSNNIIFRRKIAPHRLRLLLVGLLLAVFLLLFGGIRFQINQAQASDAYDTAIVYTSVYVNPGDTLWDIADCYMSDLSLDHNACVEELRRINHMSPEEDLQSGCYILVPYLVSGI